MNISLKMLNIVIYPKDVENIPYLFNFVLIAQLVGVIIGIVKEVTYAFVTSSTIRPELPTPVALYRAIKERTERDGSRRFI